LSLYQPGSQEECSFQVRHCEIGPGGLEQAQVRVAKYGARERSAQAPCFLKVRSRHVCYVERGAIQIRALHTGVLEIRSTQICVLKPAFRPDAATAPHRWPVDSARLSG
jgi:hypothetical protein